MKNANTNILSFILVFYLLSAIFCFSTFAETNDINEKLSKEAIVVNYIMDDLTAYVDGVVYNSEWCLDRKRDDCYAVNQSHIQNMAILIEKRGWDLKNFGITIQFEDMYMVIVVGIRSKIDKNIVYQEVWEIVQISVE